MSPARDPVRCHAVKPSSSEAPASSVITMSALPLRVHTTSEGGPAIRNAVAIQATRRENSRATRWKFRHAYAAEHASITALSVITPAGQTGRQYLGHACSAGPTGTAEILP